jgi:hypothetical protein
MAISQYSLSSHTRTPFRGPITRPAVEAIFEPWLAHEESTRFVAFELHLLDHSGGGHPSLAEGRRMLRTFLRDMSLHALGQRAFEVGDRLGSAVIRQSDRVGATYCYQVLFELPDDFNDEWVQDTAVDMWPGLLVQMGSHDSLPSWFDRLTDGSGPEYIDSVEPWAWRVPRGWTLPAMDESVH